MVYVICGLLLFLMLSFAVDAGTRRNVGRLLLILLGLIVFAAYLLWRLAQ